MLQEHIDGPDGQIRWMQRAKDQGMIRHIAFSFHDAPEEYQLTHLRVVCGSITPTAEVRMSGPWAGERSARGTGDGPISAAFTAGFWSG